MAEAVLFGLATEILKRAGSITYSKSGLVCGARDELDNLKDTVETIRVVLLDAEKKRWHSNQVENWLRKLKDVLYDVQDLLDDVATEDLKWEVTPGNKMRKAVRIFFSKSNQLAHRLKVANEIQKLWRRLEKIKKDRDFHLYEHQSEESMAIATGKKENLLPDTKIIGREEDKKKIKQLLFASSPSQSVSFVAIVGKGGLGKTALARLVYNDEEVKEHFEPKMWVCVSDVFDVNLIIKEILKSADCPDLENKPLDQLRSLLHETLDGKKYLLVLDDLWNTDRDKWVMLGDWLEGGLQGSKILITTRNHRVAEITSAKSVIYEPRGLSDDNSWDLFRKMAFGDGVESLDPKLKEMGRDIVKKCIGVPLAIRTIGGLLCGKSKDEWLRYKVHELPEIPEIDVDGGIMQVLKFSYDHLPSYLKNCFAYCSLFPKDYVYEKDTLIHLWVAQGFIESCNEEDNLENVAENYLSELLSGSFLDAHSIVKSGYGHEVEQFTMHDLMHDLAQKVAGGECKIVNFKGGDDDRGIRHASFISKTFYEEKLLSLLKTSKLRTFLSLKGESSVGNCHKVFSSCGHCRALYLDYTNIPLPPSSLGKLKKLRFLYIFRNQSIQSLPDSITDLVNLQTLKLSFCLRLQTFPRDLRKLVKLRHLLIDKCHSLSQLPPLSELPSLRTLSLKFLDVLKFVQLTSDPEPSNTTLPFFQSLESLNLHYCIELKGWLGRMQEMGAHQEHRSDNSRSSFPKLRFVYIFGCPHLNSIPSFPRVEYLSIDGTKMLEQQLMANPNCPSKGTVEATFIPFLELKYLTLFNTDMNLEPFMLKTLLQSASNLKYMKICHFDLRSLFREMQLLSSLKELDIWGCQGLDLSCQEDKHGTQWQCLTNLRALTIGICKDLVALPEGIQRVTTLQSLHILKCSSLRRLPEWIGNFSLLEELELIDCRELEHIPFEIRNFTHLKKLRIRKCPLLDGRCLADVHIPMIVWEGDEMYDSSDSD
ncbi:disease resistance protein RGA2-like [Eucalyptus grandis]|uniref:disease resistance protein RGA2-like n=1 Tax=Eucalyptus grandis TaxID=71139 RepID=UPI00192EB60C|nr:disease resistance protein RGA2-like [Eucalyptus grandis]